MMPSSVSVLPQRYCQSTARATQIDGCAAQWVARPIQLVRRKIDEVDDAFASDDAAMRAPRIRLVRRLRQELGVGDRHITERSRVKPVTVVCPKGAESRIAQPRRLFEHCVEYRREVARRAVDHLQYLCGGGLLLQGLARLGDEPGILHRDDRVIGEVQ